MTTHKIFGLIVLLAVSSKCFDMGRNDISSDQSGGRGGSPDYDPSFLDEILGPDYFEDMDSVKKISAPASQSLNSKSVESEIVASNAPCLGCPSEVDIEDPKIKEMANYAFTTYLSKLSGASGEDVAQFFVRIIKASTQVVAGFKYIMQVEIGQLNCTQSKYKVNPEECTVDESADNMICDFEVLEQHWAKTKEVLLSQCKSANMIEETTTQSYDDFSDVETGTTQEDLVLSQQDSDDSSQRRKKRDTQTGKYGGIRDAEDNKTIIDNMAKFSVEQLDVIDDDDEARMVIEVLNVKKQTVSGWLYHLKLRVAQTSCKEGSEVTMERCKDKIVLPFTICNVKILFQPWQTQKKKMTESMCFPEKMKKSKKLARKLFPDSNLEYAKKNQIKKKSKVSDNPTPLIGGPIVIQPDSEELQTLVHWAVDSVDAESNALHAQKLVKIISAEKQLVSGILTKMIIETGYTECRKQPGLDKSKCSINEAREHQFCKITVWEKPWLNEKKMTESKCGKSEEIMKRKKRETSTESILSVSALETHGNLEQQFGEYVLKYSKQYATPEEYQYRLGIFHENTKKIKLLQENEQGTATYGATVFADLTDEEFSQRHLGLRPDLRQKIRGKKAKIPVVPKLPDDFDWRQYNVVTSVKNQGSCGSCWAFSVTGNIEGLYARQHNKLVSFSEQELVDCDTLDSGCGGGLPENAYKSLEKIGGLETEQAYPYDGRNEKCHFKSDLALAKVTGFVELPKNETEMAAWLFKNGPISIGINANAMQFYFGGVSKPWKFLCSPKSLDHGVLIVGYGVHTTKYTHKTMPYWLVKNSWGPSWGVGGYYLVYRGDGTCGVNQMATSAVIA